ncbi:low molecular weight phosphatase family protein [Serinibacter arcticus]|uniref:protein-tyrosine-phosphatase n=1 Tax=Serinibacter arcticus TaxID=1655435 RepID=A0A2U1ZYB2_9MICO|nr:low molecular weight phosphatase family protein [Serinibacter arcticus]PWD51930.1 low molecular weight phosphatase family protein [Serinibacter arcticus]
MLPTTETHRPRVLVVCTGNICRSPAAALLLADALGDEVEVGSAGTAAVVGAPVEATVARLLAERGVDAGGGVAQQLDRALVEQADLVVALTREHRSQVVAASVRALRRTVTLRELARTAAGVESQDLPAGTIADRLAALTALTLRNRTGLADPAEDDVADPYRRGDAVHVAVLAQIVEATTAIGDALRR